jgi:hypothetical protein
MTKQQVNYTEADGSQTSEPGVADSSGGGDGMSLETTGGDHYHHPSVGVSNNSGDSSAHSNNTGSGTVAIVVDPSHAGSADWLHVDKATGRRWRAEIDDAINGASSFLDAENAVEAVHKRMRASRPGGPPGPGYMADIWSDLCMAAAVEAAPPGASRGLTFVIAQITFATAWAESGGYAFPCFNRGAKRQAIGMSQITRSRYVGIEALDKKQVLAALSWLHLCLPGVAAYATASAYWSLVNRNKFTIDDIANSWPGPGAGGFPRALLKGAALFGDAPAVTAAEYGKYPDNKGGVRKLCAMLFPGVLRRLKGTSAATGATSPVIFDHTANGAVGQVLLVSHLYARG